MSAHFRGAHAPLRAGDDALVIGNFFSLEGAISRVCKKMGFGEGAETSTRGACAPQKNGAASSYLTK